MRGVMGASVGWATLTSCRYLIGMHPVPDGGVMACMAREPSNTTLCEAARCLHESLADGKIAARCCGPLGKTAGLGDTSGASQGLVGNVPTRQSSRPGLDGGVMLYFETDF